MVYVANKARAYTVVHTLIYESELARISQKEPLCRYLVGWTPLFIFKTAKVNYCLRLVRSQLAIDNKEAM